MKTTFIAAALLAFSVGMAQSSFAQTTVEPSGSTGAATGYRFATNTDNLYRNRVPRNVGPDSTVGGGRSNDLGNADSGLPNIPGAPSTSGDGSTGGH